MRLIDKYFAYTFGIIYLFSLITDWYRFLAVLLFLFLLFFTVEKMGKGIVMRELISLHLVFICLVMPIIGYEMFNQSNFLARLWVRYMFIAEGEYFSYALPACSGFVTILCWPLTDKKINDFTSGVQPLIDRAKLIVAGNNKVGPFLLLFGIVMFFVSNVLPVQIQFIFYLFYFAAFAGFLYVYFDKSFKYRVLLLVAFILYIVIHSLNSGMFTVIAYMGITISSFLFLNWRVSMLSKISVITIGLFGLFLIQSIKLDYRSKIWKGEYTGNKAALYGELLVDKISALDDIDAEKLLFPIYYRTNQGYNIALVMNRFPRVKEYDKGEKLGLDIASSFVPRFLWPDKPEAGGKANMLYYAGVTLRGYSTNVGPVGEAYAAFGKFGGMIYLMLLAFFIRWSYTKVFQISQQFPLIMFWLPVLYYQVSYASEADTLQVLNSLLKASVFMYVLYRIFPILFGGKFKQWEGKSS